jgi:hypothetical protein
VSCQNLKWKCGRLFTGARRTKVIVPQGGAEALIAQR